MTAIHGGKAKNANIDAQKIAALLRGGMLPKAYVSPAAMRAPRDLLRRRTHLMHKRAALLAHVHNTNAQYHLPEIGKQIASTATRAGVAERFDEAAVQNNMEVALALIPYYDDLLRALELSLVKPAKHHDAHPFSLLQTVPGLGKMLSLGRLDDIHRSDRFPSVQDFASDCRLVQCSKDPAANVWGRQAPKAAMPTSHGPWAKRLLSSYATTRPASNIWPAWRTNRTKAKP
jgi:hypothetical protein